MTISAEQARKAVLEALEPRWPEGWGELTTGAVRSDERGFWVPYGAKEFIEGGDEEYVIMDAPLMFVDRETGEIETLTFFDGWDRVEKMEVVT